MIANGSAEPTFRARLPGRVLGCALAALASAACSGTAGGSPAPRDADMLDLLGRKPDAEVTGADEVRGPLKGRELTRAVARTVERQRPAFQACIEKDSKGKGAARAKATLLLTVRADGAVIGARVAEKQVAGRPLGDCLVDASRRMTFPRFEGSPLQVKVPLELSAR